MKDHKAPKKDLISTKDDDNRWSERKKKNMVNEVKRPRGKISLK